MPVYFDPPRDVTVSQCWGCNRLRIPRPWTPGTLDLLEREGRLQYREYLCDHADCGANAIIAKKKATAA